MEAVSQRANVMPTLMNQLKATLANQVSENARGGGGGEVNKVKETSGQGVKLCQWNSQKKEEQQVAVVPNLSSQKQ